MGLGEYKRKRKSTSPEPGIDASKKTHVFVVQKHAARRLHYDFRIELNGVLKSWAVPKGISLDPKEKHLAVQVEDHPLEYRHFEGIIPKGNYGAGTVEIWDSGTYYPVDESGMPATFKALDEALAKGKFTLMLQGDRLAGVFTLVRMKSAENNWLIFKHKDSILATASKAKMPKIIKPMLAFSIDKPFDNPDWIYEIKWDGYRAIAHVKGDNVDIYSRNAKSLNDRFKPIVTALADLHIQSAVFDGELVIVNEKGVPNFQALQNYHKTKKGDLRYYIFDLLYYAGRDLRSLPLIERKKNAAKRFEERYSAAV